MLRKIRQVIFTLVSSEPHCSLNFTHQCNDEVVIRLENCLFPCTSVHQIISLGTFGVQNIYTLNISTIDLSGFLIFRIFYAKIFFEIAFSQ